MNINLNILREYNKVVAVVVLVFHNEWKEGHVIEEPNEKALKCYLTVSLL